MEGTDRAYFPGLGTPHNSGTVQQSQMNSCFYHFKYEVQALIICDTDEYIYSYKFPFDLIATKNYLTNTTKKERSVIHV